MEQRSPEWFEARKGRVTGSNAGAILGLDPWRGPDDVLRQMVREYHGAPNEIGDNPAFAWGRANEATAIGEFEFVEMVTVKKCGFFPFRDWLGASPDGLIGDDAILEVKCPYGLRNAEFPVFKPIEAQPHYMAQMQVEMICTGRDKAHFFQWSLHGYQHTLVNRDPDFALQLHDLRDFYELYLSELHNPVHLEPKRVEINTQRTAQLLAEYDDMQEAKGRAEDRIAEIMEQLQEAAQFKDALIHGRKLTKVTKAGSIKYADVVKKHLPDLDLTPYKGKPSEYWKLT